MKYLLISFTDNWADEMDSRGFSAATEADFENWKNQELPEYNQHGFELYAGNNESIKYSSLEDYLKTIRTKEITKEQYEVLTNLFGVGITHYLDNIYYYLKTYGVFLDPFDY